jgi:heterodisulfide reductase subunit A2
MKDFKLVIDGKNVVAKEGMSVLQAANSAGIHIPTLCYHKMLEPYGGCRLCTVEITGRGKSRLLTACTYPVEESLEVKTRSEKVINARKMLLELLLARCPEAKVLHDLAREYGVKKTRFAEGKRDELCILCGLCSRVCEQVVGSSAINFTNRGVDREVSVLPEITPESCIGCGACAKVCPTGLITMEELNGKRVFHAEANLGPNTAIRIPFMTAVPAVPFIDTDTCIHFKTGQCKVCAKFCDREAINHDMTEEYQEIEVGNIIVATGFQEFDPSQMVQYGYGKLDNVVTGLEFEAMCSASGPTSGAVLMADGQKPGSVAILHCMGSRDENYHKYCSRVCCMYSLKYSHLLKEKLPDTDVYQLYIDMRCAGSGYEEFYERLQEEGVNFVRGRAAEVTNLPEKPEEKGKLVVVCDDTLIRRKRRIPVDMVIMSCALEPMSDADRTARIFSLSRKADGFFLERHPKLDPVATMTDGVFVAGCCQSPKDIPDTVAQASAAAARVLAMISKGQVEIESATAFIDEEICSGCRVCNSLCPFNAITFDEKKKVSSITEALCKGCGTCVAACASSAITARHFTTEQITSQIEGVLV